MDSDDPSLAQVLERLEDVRKGSTLVGILLLLILLLVLPLCVTEEHLADLCPLSEDLQLTILVSLVDVETSAWMLTGTQRSGFTRCGCWLRVKKNDERTCS